MEGVSRPNRVDWGGGGGGGGGGGAQTVWKPFVDFIWGIDSINPWLQNCCWSWRTITSAINCFKRSSSFFKALQDAAKVKKKLNIDNSFKFDFLKRLLFCFIFFHWFVENDDDFQRWCESTCTINLFVIKKIPIINFFQMYISNHTSTYLNLGCIRLFRLCWSHGAVRYRFFFNTFIIFWENTLFIFWLQFVRDQTVFILL